VTAPRATRVRATRYKVVETQTVTDEELERILNDVGKEGWILDGIRFAMRESSKRPAMAFVVFTRSEGDPEEPPPSGEAG
jgi:hypothetical protein